MEEAQRVIAVDIDPRARIFRFADLGVVGDVHEAPEGSTVDRSDIGQVDNQFSRARVDEGSGARKEGAE